MVFAVPVNTEGEVVARLNRELVRILAMPDVKQLLPTHAGGAKQHTEQQSELPRRDIKRFGQT